MDYDYTRYRVIYKAKKDGKQRETEITASSKVSAALRIKATLAKEVLKVIPIRK
jgi:hypothetical protein